MQFLKTEKGAALFLLVAAGLGFALANFGLAPMIHRFEWATWFGGAFGVHQLVFDFGLSAFFFLVGLELKRELAGGTLSPLRNAAAPLFAAVAGVAVPASIYLLFNYDMRSAVGWAVPTATDVTFGLAVFVLFGSALPRAARTFLLAFAVIDDLIAVLLISVLFSGISNLASLGWLALGLACFAGIVLAPSFAARGWLRVVVAVVFWLLNIRLAMTAGVEPALVAVAMAMFIPARRIPRIEAAIHPAVAYAAVPAFAFFAAAVPLGHVEPLESAIFWGIAFRPLGKFIGVFVGGAIGMRFATKAMRFERADLAAVALLGGIGFTVSLLTASLAFAGDARALAESVLATFVATGISALLAGLALSARSSRQGD